MPSFLLGIILITIFAIGLRWLPAAGNNLPGYVILPSCTLALALLPELSRVVRNAVVATMQDFYPTYGRIKGQSWLRIILPMHCGRPSYRSLPILGRWLLIRSVVWSSSTCCSTSTVSELG
ncbi:hypothetical protein FY147_27620 (plasmid) [Agrobacterium tumefaciens]|nr:hypothetical protein FY147_27620 [Agrobacterium tumefaciens]